MEVIAANLQRLREELGLTQEQVAEKAGITRVAYRNVETGSATPRADTLHSLAKGLGISLDELVSPSVGLKRVRFRSLKKLNNRAQILAEVRRRLAAYRTLEDLLGESAAFKLAVKDSKTDPKRAAEAVRSTMKLGADEPIRDICGLLEKHGVKVLLAPRATDAFFGLSVGREDGGPAVIVNAWERISVERKIFTAAHELGHLVLHLESFDTRQIDEEDSQEKEANLFAGFFLMPQEGFRSEWGASYGLSLVDRVLKVKQIFGVSYMTVLHRVNATEPGPAYYAMFKALCARRTGVPLTKEVEPEAMALADHPGFDPEPMRAREPDSISQNRFVEERLFTLTRRALEQKKITADQAADYLGISAKEMDELREGWVR